MKRIRTIILLMAMMLAWTLNAQVDTIVTASGELGNSGNDLEFLNESGGLTRFPRLSDAGELLYYPPLVTTDSVTNITSTSAMVYGNILFNGWYENVQEQGFQLSTTTDFSGSVTTHPITPENPYSDCELPCLENAYSFIFMGLTPTSTYYVRAYATNSAGTAYGNEMSFTTNIPQTTDGQPCSGAATLVDIDGNIYNTVQIGTQCWMKENLKSTRYADSTSIPQWLYPGADSSNKPTYGLLYTWSAAVGHYSSTTVRQGVCPTGWHVPSASEWVQLTDYVSSQSQYLCGSGNAKALADSTGWNSSSTTCAVGNMPSTNNATGFSARPAGFKSGNTTSWSNPGTTAKFWSTAGRGSVAASYSILPKSTSVFQDDIIYTSRCSVRCVKD